MYLIKGAKNDTKGQANSYKVDMIGVVEGERRSSTVSYTVSEASAQGMVDGLVCNGTIDRKGEVTLTRVNTGFMGVMTITDVEVTYFNKKGQGRDVTISPIAETKGDEDGFWTEEEAKAAAKKTAKAKAKAVELD